MLPLRQDGQQPVHSQPVAAGALLVLEAGGGLLGAPGLPAQGSLAGDVGPGGEGAGLAFLEVGEQLQAGWLRCW
ncbi:hypothetical protein ACFWBC_36420 [Streptomyces sp. NPDC059985]|uniref:hypothetical protein n=1 Tax=Streptomyces sp. NPDC059985 TaxID=3347025 RepID=UPI0036A09CF6